MKTKQLHRIPIIVLIVAMACQCNVPSLKAADTNTVVSYGTKDIPTVAHHKVYDTKTIDTRIDTIRDYYYNKADKLSKTNATFTCWYGSKNRSFKFTYYMHGKDLMFAYGTQGKNEFRLYFYNNQLIEMLVDEPGTDRKTFKQMYDQLESTWYDADLEFYMSMENHARRIIESTLSKTKKIVTNEMVIITKVSGSKIVYHKLYTYGSDGCLWTMDTKLYTASLSSNVKIEDYSSDPMNYTSRSKHWLYKSCKKSLGCACGLEQKNGKINVITCPYWA